MDVFTVDSASRPMPPPPPYTGPNHVPNGIPPWSVTNHTVPPLTNGATPQPSKIYDPNDEADSD